jgi:hypothetical protein
MKDLEKLGNPDEVLGWCDYANKGTDNLSAPFCYRYGDKKYIVGVVFSNEDSVALERPLLEKIAYFKPDDFVFESNQGGVEFAMNLQRNNQGLFSAIGLDIDYRSTSSNKEIRIMLALGEIKNNCYFLEDDEQDDHYRRFMSNLSNYGKYKYGKDDAPDSMAGLLSMMSESFDVEIDSLGYENKMLDTKYVKDNNEPDTEEEDSDVEIF